MRMFRALWTDADFETMSWHDVHVHAVAFDPGTEPWLSRLLLDLDYIEEWVLGPDNYYKFWLAPATLIFEPAESVAGDLHVIAGYSWPLEVDGIERGVVDDQAAATRGYSKWTIRGHNFNLEVVAKGFRQVIRTRPILRNRQWLDWSQRGGISFDEDPTVP